MTNSGDLLMIMVRYELGRTKPVMQSGFYKPSYKGIKAIIYVQVGECLCLCHRQFLLNL
jgi:hypothetical protein